MAFEKFGKSLVKIFGSRNERLVKSYMTVALEAGEYESEVRALDDDALKAKTAQFKTELEKGTQPEDILPEAFAVVREAARRNVEMRHFDVQLLGGNVLYDGKIAEMATGEGKTLVATLAAYLVHLTGRKIHVVTVNDYLAKRDAEWMAPVYTSLGLTVGAIQADMDTTGQERKDQYLSDITYGTNNEFGFDYLRDNMKVSLDHMAQGPLEFTLIDEVDSILIDEARTPLIISGPAFDDVTRYKKADVVCRELIKLQSTFTRLKKQIDTAQRTIANAQGELTDAKKAKDKDRIEAAQNAIDKNQSQLEADERAVETATQYYEVEYDRKAAHLTHEGISAAQEIAGLGSFFTGSNMEWPHMLEQGLRAHVTFEKEKDYVVIDGKVIIVDEFTGRLMHGRQWSDGLHQAVEAKENVKVKEESQTLATITLQNFFKLYGQIGGMTGTAATEADEFMNIYDLDVIIIPTNEPCVRDDEDDLIYKTIKEKFNAIVDDIHEVSAAGRPVLVGTVSIEKSEAISAALTKKYGLDHEVLNAKQHEREAHIVEKAGWQHKGRDGKMRGNVTIATNMAGRGTDIKLGEGVADIGGLHILGTERHEARRIDNQLRGRAGRQGDAGSSVFFICFEDDLMRVFAPEWTVKALGWIGWEEGQPIYHSRISKGIEKAQKKVEERNFDARKSLLEYDEVMDYQRKIFYSRRRSILAGKGLKDIIEEMIAAMIDGSCDNILKDDYPYLCIQEWARANFGADLQLNRIREIKAEEIERMAKELAVKEVTGEISLSIGEYLEDYEDRKTWDIDGLCRWAMSSYGAGLSAGKLRQATPEEIEEIVSDAATAQIQKKDCSQIDEFLREDFAINAFTQWANNKFDIKLDRDELKSLAVNQIRERLAEAAAEKYRQREIEYPVEFAMNMAYGPQGPNVYGFEALADWARTRYREDLTAEYLQQTKPKVVYEKLLEISRRFHDGYMEEEVAEKIKSGASASELAEWSNEYFGTKLTADDMAASEQAEARILGGAKEFFRQELADLERYVLLQIYDSTWKDHLYAMDHLKESIFLRAFAEKDPKIEYKQEGFRMFNEMLQAINDRVTSAIFKVRLEAGAQTRNVWNVSKTQHDEVAQFSQTERQRAAATAPQGEQKVKQIKLEKPKVGRNEPCSCGSGKKYKKCCGKNA
ncbi:MAG: preprotein translocase subunit SecA [Planctomycetes bacterium]|nr:preprotein translocase subunit SecA [Planctomycetota bacterium]